MAEQKNGTIVAPCTCESKFQDAEYGKGKRLFNLKQAGERATCTICSKEITT